MKKEIQTSNVLINNAPIDDRPSYGKELYRTDAKGRKELLRGTDYNTELLRQRARRAAEGYKDSIRTDALGFGIERDLVERDNQIWSEERAPLVAAAFIPMDSNASRYANARYYEWRKKTMLGKALVKASLNGVNANIPNVSGYMEAQQESIWNVMTSYSLTVEEMLMGDRLAFNFGAEYAAEARDSITRTIDEMLLFGSEDLDIDGFFNHPDIPTTTITGGNWYTGGSTSEQILADIQVAINAIDEAVARNSVTMGPMADTVVMSDRIHKFLQSTRTFSTATNETALDVIKNRHPELSWDNYTYELRGKGVGGDDRMMFYKKDPNVIKAAIPVPYQERPLLQNAYDETVHAYARFVPVIVHDKRSLRYVDVTVVDPG